ncbi:hypothetical protein [Aquamicrobium sp. NLF2-7]|uniref:DUF7673 family protein n=1 Tax=Aquamicrobium sp. NLF2-7 TaxID=2918753 RepID=UPI001EFBE118|nr:hypothetical protein [Aquamicrobium sp. NLF2-7]
MDLETRFAFERLLDLARSDTGQARRAADFVLAWWNEASLGRFDMTDLFAVDPDIAEAMATVFSWLSRQSNAVYPTEYRTEMEALIQEWRPDVWAQSREQA